LSNPIKITIAYADEINRLPLSKKDGQLLLEYVCGNEQIKRAFITAVFVGTEKIQELNSRFLRHDYPTDVLAFPLHDEGEVLEGEIYVCVETAEKQARDYGIPLKEELARLIVHGMLHLIGYDDRQLKNKQNMLKRGDFYVKNYLNGSVHERNETIS